MNKIFSILRRRELIIIFSSGLIVFLIYKIIFSYYPEFIFKSFLEFEKTKDVKAASGLNIGTFGDMYGALNAFVSTIAFISAMIAIFIQVYQFNKQKAFNDNELKEQNKLNLKIFAFNLLMLKQHHLDPLNLKLKSLIESGFKLSKAYLDGKITQSKDYYFRSLLATPVYEIFKSFSFKTKENETVIIEFFYLLELIYSEFKNLEKLIENDPRELRLLKSDIHNIKNTIFEMNLVSEDFSFLKKADLFDEETYDKLFHTKGEDWEFEPNLGKLSSELRKYHGMITVWSDNIVYLNDRIEELINLTETLMLEINKEV